MKLIIGNKRYSSWSLRPWLLLKHFNIEFEEVLIPLDQPNSSAEIKKYSASGKVPVLVDEGVTVWESLAIAEYLNEKYPEKQMWPKSRTDRATARSISNEMHSGFQALREHLSHDIAKHVPGYDSSPASGDIARVKSIWETCLKKSGGPFLFGDFSIADAMFAPVVNRFVTYDVDFGSLENYAQSIRDLPAHALWIRQAKSETLRMPRYE